MALKLLMMTYYLPFIKKRKSYNSIASPPHSSIFSIADAENLGADILQEEIQKWHGFQLDIETRFLAPEEAEWL